MEKFSFFVKNLNFFQPTAKVKEAEEEKMDVIVVTYQGWSCSLGVFPVSIKNEDFLRIARDPATVKRAHDIRTEVTKEQDQPCLGRHLLRTNIKLKIWKIF